MVLRIIHYLTEMKCFNFKLVQAGVLNIIFPYICNINLENMPPVEEMNTELGKNITIPVHYKSTFQSFI